MTTGTEPREAAVLHQLRVTCAHCGEELAVVYGHCCKAAALAPALCAPPPAGEAEAEAEGEAEAEAAVETMAKALAAIRATLAAVLGYEFGAFHLEAALNDVDRIAARAQRATATAAPLPPEG